MKGNRSSWRRVKMDNQILTKTPSGHREYLGPHTLTRPDWPTKHAAGTKARNLLPYLLDPQSHERVLRVSPDAVLIEDKFPKSNVHLLVLPRWEPHRDFHPHDAFEDPEFLSMVRREAAEGLKVAIPMLRKQMQNSLKKDGVDPRITQTLLNNRDFTKDFKMGIHAHPSQHELHVHIISRDMVSWHKYDVGHFRAFNTPFFVPLSKYPLPLDSEDREVEYQNTNLKKHGFKCWRCGKHYDDSAWNEAQLHLREEWQSWIRETPESSAVSNGIDLTLQSMNKLEISEVEPTRS